MTNPKDWSDLLTWFCLAVADTGAPRTIYHSRIDGLILPMCEPLRIFNDSATE